MTKPYTWCLWFLPDVVGDHYGAYNDDDVGVGDNDDDGVDSDDDYEGVGDLSWGLIKVSAQIIGDDGHDGTHDDHDGVDVDDDVDVLHLQDLVWAELWRRRNQWSPMSAVATPGQ